MNERMKLHITIARARYNIMFMFALSLLNILTIVSSNKMLMPFSSSIATYSTIFGIRTTNITGNVIFKFVGLIIAVIALALLVLCYFKSKTNDFFLIVAFGILIADTIGLIGFSAYAGYLYSFYTALDLVLHVLTIVYIVRALNAFKALSKLPKEEESNEEI